MSSRLIKRRSRLASNRLSDSDKLILNENKIKSIKNQNEQKQINSQNNQDLISVPYKNIFEKQEENRELYHKIKKKIFFENNQLEKKDHENYNYIREIVDKELKIEDESKTEQLYNKRYIQEFLTMFFSIISIGSSLLYYEMKTYLINIPNNGEILEKAIYTCLIMVSLSTLLLIFTNVLRYKIVLQLRISDRTDCGNETIYDSNLWSRMWYEILFFLFHPNIYLMNKTFTTSIFLNMREITFYYNDFLVIIVLFRSFTVLRFFINLSSFYNSRMNRIAKMLGGKITVSFAVKCLMQSNSTVLLFIVSIIWVFNLSFSIRIIEGPLNIIDNDGMDYSSLNNCIWNIFVTMTTVGYGDFYPKTNIGRIILTVTAISGTILVSFIINSLQNFVKFNENELRAFEYKERHEMKKLIDRYSWEYVVSSHRYAKMKKLLKLNLNNPNFTKTLKGRTKEKLSSLLYNKICARRNFKHIVHKFRNIYDPITDFDCIKEKLENIDKFVKNNKEKLDVNENVISKIYEQMGKIKKQIFIFADLENAKISEFKKINISKKNSILKKYMNI